MYEFTDKEVREEFKKTEYGKKINKWLKISICVTVLLTIVVSIFAYLIWTKHLLIENVCIRRSVYLSLASIIFICAVVSCYFDGKRDGAITQYKLNFKKDNKKTKKAK